MSKRVKSREGNGRPGQRADLVRGRRSEIGDKHHPAVLWALSLAPYLCWRLGNQPGTYLEHRVVVNSTSVCACVCVCLCAHAHAQA